ncbi:MAG: secondary thiamine-phosphate synthase enzyme YjbQ [Acidimicrobiia bacterium]
MESMIFDLDTGSEPAAVDITDRVAAFTAGKGDGLVQVFCPHATAGIAIMGIGAGSGSDLIELLDHLLPPDFRYRHQHGSPGHGADHVLPAVIAPSTTIPVLDGQLQLGTWQSVVFVDPNGDNPRRQVRLSFVAG